MKIWLKTAGLTGQMKPDKPLVIAGWRFCLSLGILDN
jgi:hypothetical protein